MKMAWLGKEFLVKEGQIRNAQDKALLVDSRQKGIVYQEGTSLMGEG